MRAEANRVVFVASLDAADRADVYLARQAVERAAAQVVVRADDAPQRGDPHPRRTGDQMAASATDEAWTEVTQADLAFHAELVAGANSPRLDRLYGTLLVETRLCLRSLPALHPDPAEIVAEHRALLGALTDGDEARALASVEAHLTQAAAATSHDPAPGG